MTRPSWTWKTRRTHSPAPRCGRGALRERVARHSAGPGKAWCRGLGESHTNRSCVRCTPRAQRRSGTFAAMELGYASPVVELGYARGVAGGGGVAAPPPPGSLRWRRRPAAGVRRWTASTYPARGSYSGAISPFHVSSHLTLPMLMSFRAIESCHLSSFLFCSARDCFALIDVGSCIVLCALL